MRLSMAPYCQDKHNRSRVPVPTPSFRSTQSHPSLQAPSRLSSSSPVSYAGLVKHAACRRLLGHCRLCSVPEAAWWSALSPPSCKPPFERLIHSCGLCIGVVPSPCYRWCRVIDHGMYSMLGHGSVKVVVSLKLCQKLLCHSSWVKSCSATIVVSKFAVLPKLC
jgi:hypothetical protein